MNIARPEKSRREPACVPTSTSDHDSHRQAPVRRDLPGTAASSARRSETAPARRAGGPRSSSARKRGQRQRRRPRKSATWVSVVSRTNPRGADGNPPRASSKDPTRSFLGPSRDLGRQTPVGRGPCLGFPQLRDLMWSRLRIEPTTYAPAGPRSLLHHLTSQGAGLDELEQAGLIRPGTAATAAPSTSTSSRTG